MNRAAALAFLQNNGFNGLMTQAGRLTTDAATGYGPALDRAYRAYIALYDLSSTVTTTTVGAAHYAGFEALVRAVTYDLVRPAFALMTDMSVDAPLTNAKLSQAFKALSQLAAEAWAEAASYGYVQVSNVGWSSLNLDHLEPGASAAAEYSA